MTYQLLYALALVGVGAGGFWLGSRFTIVAVRETLDVHFTATARRLHATGAKGSIASQKLQARYDALEALDEDLKTRELS